MFEACALSKIKETKMKNLINDLIKLCVLSGMSLLGANVQAQVNLDAPVSLFRGDRFFRSIENKNVVYAMPIGIYRISDFQIKDQGSRRLVEFHMGLSEAQMSDNVAALNAFDKKAKLRVFRATEAEYVGEAADLPFEFDPKLRTVQSFENLVGPTHVVLELKKRARVDWFHLFPISSLRVIEEVFGLRKNEQIFGDHIGSIEYKFIAQEAGEARIAKTRVGIYVSESHMLSALSGGYHMNEKNRSLPEPSRVEVPLKISDDRRVPCWREVIEVGEICLGARF
jgi:hypothetical protein